MPLLGQKNNYTLDDIDKEIARRRKSIDDEIGKREAMGRITPEGITPKVTPSWGEVLTKAPASGLAGVNIGLARDVKDIIKLADYPTRAVREAFGIKEERPDVKFLEKYIEGQQKRQAELDMTGKVKDLPWYHPKKVAATGLPAIPQVAAVAGAALMAPPTAARSAAAAALGAIAYGPAAEEAEAEGASGVQQVLHGLTSAQIEVITELPVFGSVGKLWKYLKAGGVGKKAGVSFISRLLKGFGLFGKSMTFETVQEMEAYLGGQMSKRLHYDPDAPITLEAMKEAGYGGATMSAVLFGLGAPGMAVKLASKRDVKPPSEAPSAVPSEATTLINMIDEDMASGEIGKTGQPFTPETAIAVIKQGHDDGILTTEDLEELGERYLELKSEIISEKVKAEKPKSVARDALLGEDKDITAKELLTGKREKALTSEELITERAKVFEGTPQSSAEISAEVFEKEITEEERVRARAEIEPLINRFMRRAKPEEAEGVTPSVWKSQDIVTLANAWNKIWAAGTTVVPDDMLTKAKTMAKARPDLLALVRNIEGGVEMMTPKKAEKLLPSQGFIIKPKTKLRKLPTLKPYEAEITYKPIVSKSGKPFRSMAWANRVLKSKGLSPTEYTIIEYGKGYAIQRFGRKIKPAPTEPTVEIGIEKLPEFSGSTEALTFGKDATPDQIKALKQRREVSLGKFEKLIATRDLNKASIEVTKAQLDKEAIDALEILREHPEYLKKPAKEVAPEKMEVVKESWEMTKAEWKEEHAFEDINPYTHKYDIQRALKEGKPVKPEIIAEYPDLKPEKEVAVEKVEKAEVPELPKITNNIVDGITVLENIPNMDSIEATLADYEILDGIREIPMSAIAVTTPKDLFYAADDIRTSKNIAEKIKDNGKIEPLIVVHDKDGLYILEGTHRLGALHEIGAKSFPALIVKDLESLGKKPAKPQPPKPSEAKPSEAVREEIKGEVIPEVKPKRLSTSETVSEYEKEVKRIARGIKKGTKKSIVARDDLESSLRKIEREHIDKIRRLDIPYKEQVELERKITSALEAVDKKYFGIYHKETGAFRGYDFVEGTKEWQALIAEAKPKVEKEKIEVTPEKKEPWEMTETEFGKLVGTQRTGYKLSGYEEKYGFSGKWTDSKAQELFIDKLSKSQKKKLDEYSKIETDVGKKKPQISYDYHLGFVKQAIKEGKTIPPEVLKDYPDLKVEEKVEVETTPEGKEISVDLTKKEEAAVTPKQQKEYLLAEIDKAIDISVEEAELDSVERARELLKMRVNPFQQLDTSFTFEVPNDGTFEIPVSSLFEFQSRVKSTFPSTIISKKFKPSLPAKKAVPTAKYNKIIAVPAKELKPADIDRIFKEVADTEARDITGAVLLNPFQNWLLSQDIAKAVKDKIKSVAGKDYIEEARVKIEKQDLGYAQSMVEYRQETMAELQDYYDSYKAKTLTLKQIEKETGIKRSGHDLRNELQNAKYAHAEAVRHLEKLEKPTGVETPEGKVFATKAIKPQDTITRADLKLIFGKMKNVMTGQDKDGNFFFKTLGRPKVTIYTVDHIEGYIDTSSGRIPVGSYLKDQIELKTKGVGPTADEITLLHEYNHFLEKNNIISGNDIKVISEATAKDLGINVKNVTSHQRGDYIGKTIVGWQGQKNLRIRRVLKKIADFVNAVYEFVSRTRTARGVLSDIERGKLLGKEGVGERAGTLIPAFQQTAPYWYSQVVKAVEQKFPAKINARSITNWIRKQGGKPVELEWLGLEEWLEEKKVVTKDELSEFLRANQVEVEEVEKKADVPRERKLVENFTDGQLRTIIEHKEIDIDLPVFDRNKAIEVINEEIDAGGSGVRRFIYEIAGLEQYAFGDQIVSETKFGQWQLPGGKNYKELLFTLPMKEKLPVGITRDAQGNLIDATGTITTQEEIQKFMPDQADFRAPHWKEPNVFAHIRFNERTDADGNKVLFLEEVQSDWALEGRKSGYNKVRPGIIDPFTGEPFEAKFAGVPDMPFKENWYQVALKRMLRYASENGFDKLAWITGEQTADRYDLSKQVDNITWNPRRGAKQGVKTVTIQPKGETPIMFDILPDGTVSEAGFRINEQWQGRSIASVVGKDIGERIIKESDGDLSGLDLKVGGEWATQLYDKMIPQYLKKFGKKWGAKVGTTYIDAGMTETAEPEAYIPKVQSITITPEMKQSAMREGMPLFQMAGVSAIGAPTGQLVKAQKMLAEGKDKKEVWRETGWLKGVEGKWKFEIDDSGAELKMKTSLHPPLGMDIKDDILSGILSHPELFKAYPELRNLLTSIAIGKDVTSKGELTEGQDRSTEGLKDLEPKITVYARDIVKAKDILLHEIQHAIQEIEGFARGGQPSDFKTIKIGDIEKKKALKQRDDLWDKAPKTFQDTVRIINQELMYKKDVSGRYNEKRFFDALDKIEAEHSNLYDKYTDLHSKAYYAEQNIEYLGELTPQEQYLKLAGEIEARDISARAKLTPEQRREQIPYEAEGIPREDWIITKGEGTSFSVEESKQFATKPTKDYRAMLKKYQEAHVRKPSFQETLEPVTAEDYISNRKVSRNIKLAAVTNAKRVASEIVGGVDRFLGSISTRLGQVSPKLKAKMRRLDFDINTKYADSVKIVRPLLEKAKKMSRDDFADWDYARKNSDIAKIGELINKYNLQDEYIAYRKILDSLRKEGLDVGMEIGEIEEYAPRILKDDRGFLKEIGKPEYRPLYSDKLKARAEEMGITVESMPHDLKADIVSNIILGGWVGLGGIPATKHRILRKIPANLNKFYMDSDAALMQHLHSIRKAIEARKFFGKIPKKVAEMRTRLYAAQSKIRELNDQLKNELPKEESEKIRKKRNKYIGLEKQYTAYIQTYAIQRDYKENIGAYVIELIEKKEISSQHERMVNDILKARFHEVGTRGIIQAYKNLSYIDTMGSPISALTQIGDLAWAAYEGGLIRTLKYAYKSATKQSRITKEDVGVERIAQEFADAGTLGNAVSRVFKIVGLEKIDSIGKEALLNTALEKYQTKAKREPLKLKREIRPVFEAETDSVIDDLVNNEISENVKLLVYSRLLDFQPVGLSEMPQGYLDAGNGRLFYMLKTFTIKVFDVYRNEVYYKVKKGNKAKKIEGFKNLARLSFYFVLANAGADELKDWVLGRTTDFSDRLVDNILRLFGVSKFVTWKARTEGVGSALARQILPPFKFIDSSGKDIITAGDEKGLEVIGSIPVVGKLAYWHLGRGTSKREDLWDRRLRKHKAKLNDIKDKFDRVEDKATFRHKHSKELSELRSVNRLQGRLNEYRKRINHIKSRKETKAGKLRIQELEKQRTEMIKDHLR